MTKYKLKSGKMGKQLVEGFNAVAEGAKDGYKNIEESVVSGYQTIENGVVRTYKSIEKKFVDRFLEESPNNEKDSE
jgi:hypothetical protein